MIHRGWEADVNAEFVAKVSRIALQWENSSIDSEEAMDKIAYWVEVTG